MKIIKEIFLKNVVVFKKASLPMDTIGITQIRGHNKDSKTIANSADVNGVGKSLLFRALSEVIFSSSPKTQDIKSRSKNDLFTQPDSEFGFTITDNNVSYKFVKRANKKSYDYKIYKNEVKDVKVRTKGYAENKIKSFLDYSEDEFYSIVFIDSGRTSKLLQGSPIERIQFFTNLFRLNSYDEVRKLFSSKLNECKKSLTILKEVEAQIQNLKTDIKDSNLESLKSKVKLAKEKHTNLLEKYSKLNSKKSELDKLSLYKQSFENFKKLSKELELRKIKTEKDLRLVLKDLENKIDDYEKNKSLIKKWEIYKSEKKSYSSKKEILENKLKALKINFKNVDFAKERLNTIREALSEAINDLKNLKDLKAPNFDFKLFEKLKSKKLESVSANKESVSKYAAKLSVAESALTSLSKIHGETCPTCTQSVNKKTLCALKEKFEANKVKYENQLEAANKNLELSIKLSELSKDYENYKTDKKRFLKLSDKKDLLLVNKSKLEKALEKAEDVYEICKKLDDLSVPDKPKTEIKKFSESKYKNQVKAKSLLDTLKSVYLDIMNKDFSNIEENLKSLDKQINKLSNEIQDESNTYSKLNSKYDLAKSHIKKIQEYESRVVELKKSVDDIPIIETLIEAYSNKGIKLLIIKQLAEMIEKNMNQYAPLIYTEQVKFKFEVKDDRNFGIFISIGKNSKADIRTLSGAEARAFSFLLPLSILPLIPYERRLNTMILDEPMANMSLARKELFVDSFVPKLNSVVPHVVIITTENEHYPNANVYTIVKENGVSTLVKN